MDRPSIIAGVDLHFVNGLGLALCIGDPAISDGECILALVDVSNPPVIDNGRVVCGRLLHLPREFDEIKNFDLQSASHTHLKQVKIANPTLRFVLRGMSGAVGDDVVLLVDTRTSRRRPALSAQWNRGVGNAKYLATARYQRSRSGGWAIGLMKLRPGEEVEIRTLASGSRVNHKVFVVYRKPVVDHATLSDLSVCKRLRRDHPAVLLVDPAERAAHDAELKERRAERARVREIERQLRAAEAADRQRKLEFREACGVQSFAGMSGVVATADDYGPVGVSHTSKGKVA
ncbi:MAG: hypothetical protein A3C15_02780 [Candidatus Magasanikbacteria bacterium RIFCSPHIGHO2_02_FULL_50_9b]|uniref:Uncharacterized protein n=1 Tax=Candidatus Magasanikbacteria bacterium RIFCSPHIGHO2_02_FULL_50_9b TaxID=1798682 RepID=A0A1F6M820_9BACT|nr:MAG: hypothetical protein A3C15_02780 [Candidatus Magasanikbacteria bacterium RIFCSPHIGHO2_02_FULL_50_9b]